MFGWNVNGEAVNQSISDFKFWMKDFFIEISPLLAFVGFLMLVVDINVRGGLATSVWFEVPWAIVQAIAVEGLLFAIWFHIFGYTWPKWSGFWPWLLTAIGRLPAIAIGLCMAMVGVAMVDIALYQELYNIADSVTAMANLHIPVDVFMHSRAILIVVTSLLAIPFGKRKSRPAIATPQQAKTAIARPRVKTVTVVQSAPLAIPEVAVSTERVNLGMVEKRMYEAFVANPDEAMELERLSKEQGIDDFTATLQQRYSQYANYITPSRVATVMKYIAEKAIPQIASSQSHSPEYENIKATMAGAVQDGRLTMTLQAIAKEAGAGYSTVKKWAPQIKEELGVN
jgi:hypothetical protein